MMKKAVFIFLVLAAFVPMLFVHSCANTTDAPTGGLKDTVHAYQAWNGEGNGFSFANYNAGDMCHVVCEAIDLYHDNPEAFKILRKRGMNEDFSWKRSAEEYHNIYRSLF